MPSSRWQNTKSTISLYVCYALLTLRLCWNVSCVREMEKLVSELFLNVGFQLIWTLPMDTHFLPFKVITDFLKMPLYPPYSEQRHWRNRILNWRCVHVCVLVCVHVYVRVCSRCTSCTSSPWGCRWCSRVNRCVDGMTSCADDVIEQTEVCTTV